MVDILCLPNRVIVSAVFTDPAVMPQIIGNLDDQIPQFKLLCVFRRNPGKSYLSAYDVPVIAPVESLSPL